MSTPAVVAPVRYAVSKHKKVSDKRGNPLRRFNLTVTWGQGDEARALTLKGCIVGVKKDGTHYAFKGDVYRSVEWNRRLEEDILDGFREGGLLEDLVPTAVWLPEDAEELAWEVTG